MKSEKANKYASLHLSKKTYKKLKGKKTRLAIRRLATQRLTKYAVAELLSCGRFATSLESAIAHTFKVPLSTLTKKERKRADVIYKIAQADFMSILHQLVLHNDRAHATLKIIAQIRGLISEEQVEPKTPRLNVYVNEHKSKDTSKKVTTTTGKDVVKKPSRKPLMLVSNGD